MCIRDSHLYELLDLGFGRCRFALAVKQGDDFFGGYGPKTIATKYPKIARSYFQKQGLDVSVVKIEGSVELAPLLGLADEMCIRDRDRRYRQPADKD